MVLISVLGFVCVLDASRCVDLRCDLGGKTWLQWVKMCPFGSVGKVLPIANLASLLYSLIYQYHSK